MGKKSARKLKKLHRQNKKKITQRVEAIKKPIAFSMAEAEPAIIAAVDGLPKSIYDESLRGIVSFMTAGAKAKANVALTAAGRKVTDSIISRLQDRLLGVVEQHQANMSKVVSAEILPDGCRFHENAETYSTYVIEQKPQVRCIHFTDCIADHRQTSVSLGVDKRAGNRYKVALPYVVFVIRLTNGRFAQMHVFYRTRPLVKLDDDLLYTNFPNQQANGLVCTGNDNDFYTPSDPPAKQIADAIKHYWVSMFNTDLSEQYWEACNHSQLENLRTWVKSSESDPMFMLNIPWKNAGSLRAFLALLAGSRSNHPLSGVQIRLTETVNQAMMDLQVSLNLVTDQFRNDLNGDSTFVMEAFKKSLRQSVFEAARTTVDGYKRQMEKLLQQVNAERERYVKLVNKDRLIVEQTAYSQGWPGGNW